MRIWLVWSAVLWMFWRSLGAEVLAAPPPGQSALLNGMHDIESAAWMKNATPGCDKGWITDLRYIGTQGNPAADCHLATTQAGLSIIQRLDVSGSESYPHDPAQATAYANTFAAYVAQCPNIHVWIVGNEPNFTVHKSDPDCSSSAYAKAYAEVHKRVHSLPGHQDDIVLLASNSPYSPGCLASLRSIIRYVKQEGVQPDGFAAHAYTRAPNAGQLNASLVTDTRRQTDPTVDECPGPITWNDTWYSHFLIYRDYIGVMEAEGMRGKPVFVTESGNACDPVRGNACYPNADVGYFQALYKDAHQWNSNSANLTKIRAITPYRWTINDDGTGRDFAIGQKPGLLGDLTKAFAQRYAWTTIGCGGQTGCTKDADCPQGQRCDTPSGQCAAPPCKQAADCPAKICSPNNCSTSPGQCVDKGEGSFSWQTNPPVAGQELRIQFTHPSGWTHIGLRYCGPATGTGRDLKISRDPQDRPIWAFTIGPLPAGRYRVDFTADNETRIIGSTELIVPSPCSPKPEECNNQDDDCDGQVDEDFVGKDASCNVIGQRGPCRFGKKACVNGAIVCQQSVSAAPAENCANGGNGIDDDCNGLVDDGCTCPMDGRQIDCYGGPTATRFVSPCRPGKLTCGAGGIWGGCIGEQTPNFIELCNGIDDNCDGFVDEGNPEGGAACVVSAQKGICQAGTQKCQNGALTCVSNQTAQTEVCNGKDDDCDGQTDETDPRVGRACTVTGQKGPCAVGEIACRNGQLECQKKVQSAAETCDGTDEDCDGKIDNVPNAPLCPKQDGVCKGASQLCAGKAGFVACTAGDYYRKNNNYEVAETRCDGLDNDCDGKVDIGKDGKALSRPCYDGPANTRSVGACKDGVQTCENGQWGACKEQVKPLPERCGNLLDDDCNGIPDAKEANCSCWGGGTAGEFLVRNTIVLDKAPRKNSSLPEIYWAAVEAFKDGAKTVTVSDAAGFDPGDAAVLIQMQGSKDRVGVYELVRVLEKTGKDIKLQAAVEKIYGATTNGDLSGQKVRLVRVPTFERVIIDGQGELTVSAWDGNQGGLLVMQVKEYVRVANGGRLHVDGKGYRGAPSVSGTTQPGTAGESLDALPSQEGGGSAGGAGSKAASGGGGGYVEAGGAGKDSDGQAAGTGGKTYGGTLEDRLVLGSGGGAGGIDNSSAGNKNDAVGAGGAGGGIVLLWARTLNLNGGFSARGLAGGDAASAGGSVGGGGGGSGGSMYVVAERVVLYEQTAISAAGGEGGRSSVLEQGTRKVAGKSIGGSGSSGKIEIRIGKDTNNKRLLFGKELGGFSPVPILSELPTTCN